MRPAISPSIWTQNGRRVLQVEFLGRPPEAKQSDVNEPHCRDRSQQCPPPRQRMSNKSFSCAEHGTRKQLHVMITSCGAVSTLISALVTHLSSPFDERVGSAPQQRYNRQPEDVSHSSGANGHLPTNFLISARGMHKSWHKTLLIERVRCDVISYLGVKGKGSLRTANWIWLAQCSVVWQRCHSQAFRWSQSNFSCGLNGDPLWTKQTQCLVSNARKWHLFQLVVFCQTVAIFGILTGHLENVTNNSNTQDLLC